MTGISNRRDIVIVTGASSGIGAATAQELAAQGFHVLAGVRRAQDADTMRAPNIEPVILDITTPDHIHALAERIASDPHGRALRALVNNAGVPVNVPVETYPVDRWRRLFEVNLFGHVAVTQALLPHVIRAKGRVVNISSVGGKVAMATYGPYGATKFALEAVSDALRRETAHFGLDVIVVEPGAVRTEMLSRATAVARDLAAAMTSEQTARYGNLVEAVAAQAADAPKWGVPPEAAARVIAKAVTARRPRTRYTVGKDAAMITFLARILSDRMLDRIAAATLRPYFPKPAAQSA